MGLAKRGSALPDSTSKIEKKNEHPPSLRLTGDGPLLHTVYVQVTSGRRPRRDSKQQRGCPRPL